MKNFIAEHQIKATLMKISVMAFLATELLIARGRSSSIINGKKSNNSDELIVENSVIAKGTKLKTRCFEMYLDCSRDNRYSLNLSSLRQNVRVLFYDEAIEQVGGAFSGTHSYLAQLYSARNNLLEQSFSNELTLVCNQCKTRKNC